MVIQTHMNPVIEKGSPRDTTSPLKKRRPLWAA